MLILFFSLSCIIAIKYTIHIGISCNVESGMSPKAQDYQTMIETFFKQVIECKDKIKNISYLKIHLNMMYNVNGNARRWRVRRVPFIFNMWKCMELVGLMIQLLTKTSINCMDLHAIRFSRKTIEYLKFWFREPFGNVYIKPVKNRSLYPWQTRNIPILMNHVVLTQYQRGEA